MELPNQSQQNIHIVADTLVKMDCTFLGQLAGDRLGSRAVEKRHERHNLKHLGVLDSGRELSGEREVGEGGVRVHRVGRLVPVGDEDFSDLALRVRVDRARLCFSQKYLIFGLS